MLKNYFKIAWRNVVRHRQYAFINISGLAIGIAACLLLFTVVKYELSYDKFQPNYSRIYHVASKYVGAEGQGFGEGIPYPAYDALKASFPQVKTGTLFQNYDSQVAVLNPGGNNPDKKFLEETGIFFSDAQFFSVFHYKWLAGSPEVLNAPDMVVLTKKMAEKYFGNWDAAMGRLLKIDNTVTAKVAGIIDDIPENTDFPLGAVASFESIKRNPDFYGYRPDWGNVTSSYQAFMLVPDNVSVDQINKQFIPFCNANYDNKNPIRDKIFYFLQPLSQIHFNKTMGTFGDHTTSKSSLWTLSLIGLFIIVMACINFINLSTAQAVGRSKEIGLRKVLGSNRSQIFWQVIGETLIIVVSAVILASVIAYITLPFLKNVASIKETLSLFNSSTFLFIGIIIAAVTLLAGSYPSLILSGFKPVLALKNKITSANLGGISLRRILVVSQFVIAQVLIVGTIVAISQMNYIRNADLGFNKDAVYVLNSNVDSSVVARQPAFKQALLGINGVEAVSLSSDVPSSENFSSGSFSYDHRPDERFELYRKFADEDFFKTYGLKIVAGRPYAKSDTAREVVVNETLVKKLGIKNYEDVVGRDIRISRNVWCTIAGVVADFKTSSMREDVKPLVITSRNIRYYYTGIKLKTSNLQQVTKEIEKTWNSHLPEFVYNPSFLDNRIKDFYTQENQMALLYKIFAVIAIIISCLGLYGLVSFMVSQKVKEVGIRKALGASVRSIVYLFSKEFTILILIAFAIAVPTAYYFMGSWLRNFAFRINIGATVFIIAILVSIVFAWLTVGYKSIKAAIANPVKSLRAE